MYTVDAPAERAQSAASAPIGPAPVMNAVTRTDARPLDTVRRYRRRLDQSALRVSHPGREPYDLILRDGRKLGHPAPRMGEADACHDRAEMLQPAAAIRAFATVREGHDRHAIPLGNAADTATRRNDIARKLVAENLRVLRSRERVRLDRSDDRTGYVLVQIRAANAAGGHPNHDLAGARRRWFGYLFDPEVSRLVEAKSAHGYAPVVSG